jgi:hypothetical protein
LTSTLVNVLIIGAIGVVAWLAIGSPTTIPELKQDIENIKQEFASGTTPQTASAQPSGGGGDTSGGDGTGTDTSATALPPPPPAANASDPGTSIPVPQTSPVSPIPAPEPPALDNSTAPDVGTVQGTAAPPPPLAPALVPAPKPIVHPPPPAVKKTHPVLSPAGHPSHLQAHQHAVQARKVVHNPPHAVAKTHAKHEEYGKGYKGTRGWYTFKGHHHCTKGEPGCVCTDPSKCKVTAHGFDKPGKSHYAHAYYTGNMIYSEYAAESNLYTPY